MIPHRYTSSQQTRHLARAALLLTALLLAASTAQAQRVQAYLDADSARVGDRFHLTLVALHGFAAAPAFPDYTASDSAFGDLVVIDIAASGSRLLDADSPGARLDSVIYEVTTFALDTATVPPLTVSFDDAEGPREAASDSLFLPIISLVPAEASTIEDLAPLFDFSGPLWPYLLLILAVVLLVGLLLYYLHQRRQTPEPEPPPPPPPSISPYEAALTRLRRLETAALDAPDEIKPFFVELSDVLRTYLEDGLGVPALERTTRELMSEFEQHTVRHKLPGGAPQRVHGILELADLVKFADIRPPDTQSRMVLGETRKTVDVIEAKLRQIAMDRERMTPRVHISAEVPQEAPTPDVP